MIRDLLLAFYFGASLAHFFVAFRLVYLFRRLFGEGAVQPGFIPHFQKMREEGDKAYLFFRDALFSLSVPLLTGIVGVEIILYVFTDSPFFSLLKILLPSIFFLFLYVIGSSFLQSHNEYFLSSAMPALANITWIIAIFFASKKNLLEAESILAVGVLLGFIFQGTIPFLRAIKLSPLSAKEWVKMQFFTPECKALFFSIFWLLIGVGVTQINSAIDSFFALLADPKGAAYLWYAIRLQQLPLALFAIAFSGALLPSLSTLVSKKNDEEINRIVTRSFLHILALILPATLIIFLTAPYLISLFFGRGAFMEADLIQTTNALYAYSAGLLPMSLCIIYSSLFFAKKRYKLTAVFSLFAVVSNLLLNSLFLFWFQWGVVSIALATSISALLQLSAFLFYQQELSGWKSQGKEIVKIVISSLAAYSATLWIMKIFGEVGGEYIGLGAISYSKRIALPVVIFLGIYVISCKLLAANSFLELIRWYEPRTRKQEQRL